MELQLFSLQSFVIQVRTNHYNRTINSFITNVGTDLTKPRPKITGAIDVWALGVTLYCLIFARCPFIGDNEYELFRNISNQPLFIPESRLKPEAAESAEALRQLHCSGKSRQCKHVNVEEVSYHEFITTDLRDLLEKMLVKDPMERITIPEIKRHPWILNGLEDPMGWIEDSDPQLLGPVEVSVEDLECAVVAATVFGRVKNSIKKAVAGISDVVGFRRRAHSAVAIPASTNITGNDDTTVFIDNDADYATNSDAEKPLQKRRCSLAATPAHPSPLHHAMTPSNNTRQSHSIPSSTPITYGSLPTVDRSDTHSRWSKAISPNSFSSKFGVGKIMKRMKSKDMIEPASKDDAIEPGDADNIWTGSETFKFKQKKDSKIRGGSFHGWSGVLRRGSKHSSDSIMRLAAGFPDHRSSRSTSPMMSMPTSPILSQPPLQNFITHNDSRYQNSSASLPRDHFHPQAKDIPLPFKPSRHSVDIVQSGGGSSCLPTNPEEFDMTTLFQQSKQLDSHPLSGDDSSVSNRTAIFHFKDKTAWHNVSVYDNLRSRDTSPSPTVPLSIQVSPRTRSPLPPQSSQLQYHEQQSDILGKGTGVLISSSSEERFATSSLSNSTSFPSVLSTASSLTTEDHWPGTLTASPKHRLSSVEQSPVILSPKIVSRHIDIPDHIPESPVFFVEPDNDLILDGSSLQPPDEDYAAEDDDDDDDDDDNDGIFLSTNKKFNRSISTSIIETSEQYRKRMLNKGFAMHKTGLHKK